MSRPIFWAENLAQKSEVLNVLFGRRVSPVGPPVAFNERTKTSFKRRRPAGPPARLPMPARASRAPVIHANNEENAGVMTGV